MTTPTFPLESERMLFRPNQPDDFDFLLDLYQRPDVVRFLPWGLQDEDGIHALLARREGQETLVEDDDKLNLICLDKESGARIGEFGLFLRTKEHKGGEVGYVVHPDFAGKGYAKEGASRMLELGFDFFGMHRIIARCDQLNRPSEAVMKALGMRHEATLLENWIEEDGSLSNELNYAILKREWDAAK